MKDPKIIVRLDTENLSEKTMEARDQVTHEQDVILVDAENDKGWRYYMGADGTVRAEEV